MAPEIIPIFIIYTKSMLHKRDEIRRGYRNRFPGDVCGAMKAIDITGSLHTP